MMMSFAYVYTYQTMNT